MPKRNRTTVRIDSPVIIGEPEFTQTGHALRSEGLIELNDIHLVKGESGALQRELGGRHWTHPHNPRLHAGRRARHHTRHRRELVRLQRRVGREQQRRRSIVEP